MGFREGAFATVWEVTDQGGRFSKVKLSTSRKDKETDEYVTDFTGFVSLIGDANSKVDMINDALGDNGRCRIKLGACDVSNKYDKDAGREYVNYALFDFEFPEERSADNDEEPKLAKKTAAKSAKKPTKAKAPALSDGEEDDEDLPF